MGWISKKFTQNRYKWGRPISEEKRRAPLRRIVGWIRHPNGLFDDARVILECGHEATTWGTQRARCLTCLQNAENRAMEDDRGAPPEKGR